MTEPDESLATKALGTTAEEFSQSARGAGSKLGEAGLILAEQAVVAAKGVRALLAPVRLLIYGYEQLEKRFIPLVQERAERIPIERRTGPPLMIAGPTIEAAKFATEETEICKLFANLLVTSMDAETQHCAHPAFVDLIKHLTPDEARIIKLLSKKSAFPVVDLHASKIGSTGYIEVVKNASCLGHQAGVQRHDLTQSALDNLCRLGLCEMPFGIVLTNPGAYDEIEADKQLLEIKQRWENDGYKMSLSRRAIRTTLLGQRFIKACVVDRTESN